MTKKHFEQAAEIVSAYPGNTATSKLIKHHVCDAFIALFKQNSARFDVERFRTACGL